MADDDKKDEQELSEDEKLAAEWEAAMEESGDEGEREDEWAAAMAEAGEAMSAVRETRLRIRLGCLWFGNNRCTVFALREIKIGKKGINACRALPILMRLRQVGGR